MASNLTKQSRFTMVTVTTEMLNINVRILFFHAYFAIGGESIHYFRYKRREGLR
jgi:hypothetical protein